MTEGAGRLFCHLGREISPLRFASVEMTGGALANIVILSGGTCRYGADGKRSHDTLSREISRVMLPVPSEEGDFSTTLRFGRNDGRGARQHRHLERRYVPVWETDGNRSHDTLSREISHSNAARTIRGGDFSTLWRLCIESPSQPKLASSLHNKRLSYWRLTGFGRNDDRGSASTVISSGGFMRRLSRGV